MYFKKFVNNSAILLKKRRGLSQIMGGLLMLAIVVPLGSVVLFSGITEITAFNNSMSNTVEYQNNAIREDLVFEHIRFEPNSKVVTISALNTGSVEIVVDRITLVNMTNQEILFDIYSVGTFVPIVLQIQNSSDIDIVADLDRYGSTLYNWEDGENPTNWEYRISIITARGNFFDTVARPYNT
jgi:hypothetical protein